MNLRFFSKLILFMTIFLFIGSSFSYAKSEEKKQVVLILINNLSFTDQTIYEKYSGFMRLDELAAKGFININSGGSRNAANSYLTIGVGSKANGNKELNKNYMANEIVGETYATADEIYMQQTGKIREGKDYIYLTSVNKLYHQKQKFPFLLGNLGEIFKSNNINSKVYGNNDTFEEVRYSPLITMDNDGISHGNVGKETIINDNRRPYGIKTNYKYLLDQFLRTENEDISLLVFDLGDIYRLEEYQQEMTISHSNYLREEIYKEIGTFIDDIIENLRDEQLLIVASPMVNNQAISEGYILSPIWIYQKNTDKGLLLTSNTTKREGIVANIDISPTILKYLDIQDKPKKIIGEEIKLINSKVDLDSELKHISIIYSFRGNVLYVYVLWQIIVLLIAFCLLFSKKIMLEKIIKAILIGILYIPLIFLLTSIMTPVSLYLYIIFILLLSVVLGIITIRLSLEKVFFFVGFITFFSLSLDILFDSFLIKRSFLGYDPIIGARYYGIGNEYMGVYIGATLLFTSSLLNIKNNFFTRIGVISIYLASIFILLFPTLGTNAGGAITAIIAMVFTLFKIYRVKFNAKNFFKLFIWIFLGVIFLVILNYLIPIENQSHIGKAVNQAVNGDISTIYQTIIRKLNMNWKLIQISSWSKVIIISLIVIGVLFVKNSFRKLNSRYPYMFYGFYGNVLGAFVSLLVNDSGVVSAAGMIIFVAIPMLYIGLEQKELEIRE